MKKILFLLFFAFAASNVSAKVVGVFCFFADGKNSVYEDQAIRIYIDANSLCVLNKTDDVIYVDKGNTFHSLNGKTECLYTNASYTDGSSRGHGASVNVGSIANALGVGGGIGRALNGVTVGGGTTNLNSTTIFEQRIIAMAPHTTYTIHTWDGMQQLILNKLGNGKTIRPRKAGRAWDLNINYSPIRLEALVAYAQKEDFSDMRKVTVSNYVSNVRMAHKNASISAFKNTFLYDKTYFTFAEGFPSGIKILAISCGAMLIPSLCLSDW